MYARTQPLDAVVALIGQFFVPGSGCLGSWKHCSSVGAAHTCDCLVACVIAPVRCLGACGSCCLDVVSDLVPDRWDGSKCCMTLLCIVAGLATIIPSILCATDGGGWCVMVEIIAALSSSTSGGSDDDY
mgnify:CR=1 FL=1